MSERNDVDVYRRIVSEERSLAILRILYEQASYSVNLSVMVQWLHGRALGGPKSEILEDVRRLEGLLVVRILPVEDEVVFRLTERGCEFVEGRAAIEDLPRLPPDWPHLPH